MRRSSYRKFRSNSSCEFFFFRQLFSSSRNAHSVEVPLCLLPYCQCALSEKIRESATCITRIFIREEEGGNWLAFSHEINLQKELKHEHFDMKCSNLAITLPPCSLSPEFYTFQWKINSPFVNSLMRNSTSNSAPFALYKNMQNNNFYGRWQTYRHPIINVIYGTWNSVSGNQLYLTNNRILHKVPCLFSSNSKWNSRLKV